MPPVGFYSPAALEVRLWYNNGPGWVMAQTVNYSAVSHETFTDRVTLTIDGMGPYTDFGIDSVRLQGTATCTPIQVEWKETTVPTEYDATPSGASAIPFVAIAGT